MSGLVVPVKGFTPKVASSAFIAVNATLVGDVEIGAHASIWFGVILRGDGPGIRIGENSNLQDGTVVHVDARGLMTIVGSNVTVGHMALLHACEVQDGAFIGMHSTVSDAAVVESGAMVAAGALVTPGKRVKRGELWAGSPAKFMRPIGEKEIEMMTRIAPEYVELAREYVRAGVAAKAPD